MNEWQGVKTDNGGLVIALTRMEPISCADVFLTR